MKIVDVNIILYAVNNDSPFHLKAKTWWDSVLSGTEIVGIPWIVILGFIRISTNHRVFDNPILPEKALDIVDGWLGRPQTQILHPSTEHWRYLKEHLLELGAAGNITSDAHLATLAIENGATLYSTDNDFTRFKNLKWINPLSQSGDTSTRNSL